MKCDPAIGVGTGVGTTVSSTTKLEQASARAAASGRGSVRVEWGAAVPLPRLTLGLEAGAQPTLVGHY